MIMFTTLIQMHIFIQGNNKNYILCRISESTLWETNFSIFITNIIIYTFENVLHLILSFTCGVWALYFGFHKVIVIIYIIKFQGIMGILNIYGTLHNIIRAYSQLGYPKGRSNRKMTTKDYFRFLLHLLFHDYRGLIDD
jgi:hypothetical protein